MEELRREASRFWEVWDMEWVDMLKESSTGFGDKLMEGELKFSFLKPEVEALGMKVGS